MDKLDKLLQKIPKQDREVLINLMVLLSHKQLEGLDIVKIKESPYYRLRKGRFRIIFYYGAREEFIIKTVRIRNEKTYKNI
jgi:mRNA-degrading endonuclease RelE of RelBE toxin-antitoxin system